MKESNIAGAQQEGKKVKANLLPKTPSLVSQIIKNLFLLANVMILAYIFRKQESSSSPSQTFNYDFARAFNYTDAFHSIERVAAPWHLSGNFIAVLAGWAKEKDARTCATRDDRFPPSSSSGLDNDDGKLRLFGNAFIAMLVAYENTPVGSYDELVLAQPFLPSFRNSSINDNGKVLPTMSITKIYVSTIETLINGRENWNVPKQLAVFEKYYFAMDDGLEGLEEIDSNLHFSQNLGTSYDLVFNSSLHNFVWFIVKSAEGQQILFATKLQLRYPSTLSTPSICFDQIPKVGNFLQSLTQPTLPKGDGDNDAGLNEDPYSFTQFNLCGPLSLASIKSIEANGPVSCLKSSLSNLVMVMDGFNLEFKIPAKGKLADLITISPVDPGLIIAAIAVVTATSCLYLLLTFPILRLPVIGLGLVFATRQFFLTN